MIKRIIFNALSVYGLTVNCDDGFGDLFGDLPDMNGGGFSLPDMNGGGNDGGFALPDMSGLLPSGCTQQDLANVAQCRRGEAQECTQAWIQQINCAINVMPDACNVVKQELENALAKCGSTSQQGGGGGQQPNPTGPETTGFPSAAVSTSACVFMTVSSLVVALMVI